MTFSITHAAFEGFRVMRRAPLAVVMWGVTYFVALALILAAAGAAVVSMIQGFEGAHNDPAATMAVMGSVLTIYLIAIPLFLIVASIIVAATCRAVLAPNKPGFFYMRLGGAEFRLMGAYLVVAIAAIVGLMLVGMLFALVAGGAFLASGGAQPGAAPSPAIALFYPLYFGAVITYVWVSVRLSLLGPITVAEGRFALGRAWAATKGRFWTLLDLGAATVTRWFLIYFAAICLFSMLMLIGISMFAGDMAAMETETPAAVMSRILPLMIGAAVLFAAFAALQFTVLSTPFAAFYRDVIAKPAVADTHA